MKKIIVVGGGKGGVGKSMLSMCLLDMIRERLGEQCKDKLLYIETDDSNADVYKAVMDSITCDVINLDTQGGNILMGDAIEKMKPDYVVVNTAARATESIIQHSGIISSMAHDMKMNLIMAWAMNRQRDGLELLKSFMDKSTGYEAVYAVKNLYFGDSIKFSRYDNSKLKDRVTKTLELPELNDMLADRLIDERWPLWVDKTHLTSIKGHVLSSFRKEASKNLEPIIA